MNRVIAIAALLLATQAHAQGNLVPNPSFEEYTTCPDLYGQADRCLEWHNLGILHSADYFNACDGSGPAGVPVNALGQQTADDGNAYMGMATYEQGGPFYRELIGAQLTQPLEVGVPVRLCFRTTAGGFSQEYSNSARFASKNIGMRFYLSGPPVFDYTALPFENNAALHLDQVLTDTSNWITVSGLYVPDSAYQWVVFGNFFADSLCSVQVLDSVGGGWHCAYAFVDNVSVSYDLSYCGVTGIDEQAQESIMHVENPFSDRLRVVLSEPSHLAVELRLWNMIGELVMIVESPPGVQLIELNTGQLTSGHYMLTGREGLHSFSPIHVVNLSP